MTVRSLALSALLILVGGAVGGARRRNCAVAGTAVLCGFAPGPKSDVDVSKLPLNLTRLQKQLQAAVARDQQMGPSRIQYNIDVLGTAPRIRLIAPGENLRDAPAPRDSSHREMMNWATPQEFRAPVMDFNSLARWIQSRSGKG